MGKIWFWNLKILRIWFFSLNWVIKIAITYSLPHVFLFLCVASSSGGIFILHLARGLSLAFHLTQTLAELGSAQHQLVWQYGIFKTRLSWYQDIWSECGEAGIKTIQNISFVSDMNIIRKMLLYGNHKIIVSYSWAWRADW